ncbi:MAG: glycosyltransferase family 2 protein, partial [bacterium]
MNRPFVSVVVPARNESLWIEGCVRGVLKQDYPADRMEIIVVDGCSTDNTRGLLEVIASQDSRLRILDNPAGIVPSSLNLAIRESRGDIIVRVDVHTQLAADYLDRVVDVLERTAADNAGGPMVSLGGGVFGDAVARAMASRFGVGASFHFASEEMETDTVYMGAWPRRVFEEQGLFDEELVRNQDDEFNYRLRGQGGRIVLSPDIKSWYQNRQTWRSLAIQFFQYGTWKVRVLQKHRAQMSLRHFVPPLFDAALLLGLLVSPFVSLAGPLVATAVLAYLLFAAAVACKDGKTPSASAAGVLALATIHHAWGVGFLWGLLRFANRW